MRTKLALQHIELCDICELKGCFCYRCVQTKAYHSLKCTRGTIPKESKEKTCDINKSSRKNCRACRWERCIKKGIPILITFQLQKQLYNHKCKKLIFNNFLSQEWKLAMFSLIQKLMVPIYLSLKILHKFCKSKFRSRMVEIWIIHNF